MIGNKGTLSSAAASNGQVNKGAMHLRELIQHCADSDCVIDYTESPVSVNDSPA